MAQSANVTIKLPNVRLSFPSVFAPTKFDENSTPKYSATFRLDKERDGKTIKEVQKAITAILTEHKVKSLSPERIALKDGDDTGHEEDVGFYIIKASNNKRPIVLNKDKTPLTDEDGVIYAGCRVNGIISLYWQDHPKFGKRVNASLGGIMFAADDEPFGTRGASVDDFSDFGDDEEAF